MDFKWFFFIFSVPFRHGERIGFSYLVSQKYTGDSSEIKILRNSNISTFNMKLKHHKRLIPSHNKGRPPSYYIIAGFVFSTVSVPYLKSEVSVFLFFCAFTFTWNCNQPWISALHLQFATHLVSIFSFYFKNWSCLNFILDFFQYGKEYEYEAPVKLLDKLLYSMPQSPDEQLVVVSQVLIVLCVYLFLQLLMMLYLTIIF